MNRAPIQADNVADWTVMVYAAHDNNLETSLYGDLDEMKKSSAKNVNFVVFVDRTVQEQPPDDNDWFGISKFADAKVFKMTSKGATDIKELGESYSMNPSTLSWFVNYALTKYPARQTMLVMSDHGGGAISTFGTDESDTAKSDANALGTMLIPEFSAAMKSALTTAKQSKINALVWATCLNANYEVARAAAPYFDLMAGSEEIILGSASEGVFDYDFAVKTPSIKEDEVGVAETEQYLEALLKDKDELYRNGGGQTEDFTSSIIDLRKMSTLDAALASFVRVANSTNSIKKLLQARASGVLEFAGGGILQGETIDGFGLIDLGDFLARIPSTVSGELINARNTLLKALENSRLYMSNGKENTRAQGLSIYFPKRVTQVSPDYAQIPDSTGWGALIAGITSKVKITEVPSISATLTATTLANGWKAVLTTSSAIDPSVNATAVFGIDGSTGVQQIVAPRVVVGAGGNNSVQTTFTNQQFSFGAVPVSAFIDAVGASVSVDGLYVRASSGQQVEARMSATLSVVGKKYVLGAQRFVQSDGTASIGIAAGDIFAPITYTWGPSTTKGTTGPVLTSVANKIERGVPVTKKLTLQPLPAGKKYAVTMSLFASGSTADLVIVKSAVKKK